MTDYNGILVVDKEKDWTSHDVCAFIRSRFKIKKVGHAGTLDPLATGVLVVLLGQATKKSKELSSCDKDYHGTLELGKKTDSHDITGKVLEERDWKHVTEESLRQAFDKFTGVQEQLPPMGSALKKDGVRLYELARQGKTVEREKRPITVYEFRIEEINFPFVQFFAKVSKGTYLRTLVNDLGEHLGSLGVLKDLRRLRSGSFSLQDSVPISELRKMNREELKNWVKPAPVSLSV